MFFYDVHIIYDVDIIIFLNKKINTKNSKMKIMKFKPDLQKSSIDVMIVNGFPMVFVDWNLILQILLNPAQRDLERK